MEHLDDSEVWGILLLKCGCGGHRVLSFPSLYVITFLFLQPGAGTIGAHFLLSHYLDNSGIMCFHVHGLLPATSLSPHIFCQLQSPYQVGLPEPR